MIVTLYRRDQNLYLILAYLTHLVADQSNFRYVSGLAVWLSGNTLVTINEVTLRQARLILGWVTVYGQVLWYTISVCNQPPRSTQPSTLCWTVK